MIAAADSQLSFGIAAINSWRINQNSWHKRRQTETERREKGSHLGLNSLRLPNKEFDKGELTMEIGGIVRRGIVWVLCPLYEAEHNRVLLPGEEISHRVECQSLQRILEAPTMAERREDEYNVSKGEETRKHREGRRSRRRSHCKSGMEKPLEE